jgi:hypothetical protein
VRRVLEQTIERVEHLVRKQEEEFSELKDEYHNPNTSNKDQPGNTSIIQTFLTVELNHKPLLQIVGSLPHDLGITVLKDMVTANFNLTVSWLSA